MVQTSVLIVEDEADLRELLAYNLRKEGFRVACAADGQEALLEAEARPPDLVLLDLLLPDVDGLTVCRKLKTQPRTKSAAIVMLTAKGEEIDVVSGLNVGADDYVTKPFSLRVLIARVRAVLRRREEAQAGPVELDSDDASVSIHELVIHSGRHEVLLAGRRLDLTATEFRVLRLLARKPGWVFSRQQILDALHGDMYAITERAVDVQIVGLRKKLGQAARYIETIRGVGYRFRE
jgi:two-component system, OmpR family, alkaline phosphatase synthesis response regulator PhoP